MGYKYVKLIYILLLLKVIISLNYKITLELPSLSPFLSESRVSLRGSLIGFWDPCRSTVVI